MIFPQTYASHKHVAETAPEQDVAPRTSATLLRLGERKTIKYENENGLQHVIKMSYTKAGR